MIKKIYRTVVFGILGIAIFYLLFFFTYNYISKNRLDTIEEKSDFDITAILDIANNAVKAKKGYEYLE